MDFDTVYEGLLMPALRKAGLAWFRASEEATSADIHTGMFYEIATADFILADISTRVTGSPEQSNGSVGVRHDYYTFFIHFIVSDLLSIYGEAEGKKKDLTPSVADQGSCRSTGDQTAPRHPETSRV